MKEGLEHADHGAQPGVVGHHGDLVEIVPVLDSDHAVVPRAPSSKPMDSFPMT